MILSPLCASDELQMTAREGKDTSSDSLSATLALRMLFGRVTFSPLLISHHLLQLPSSLLPPLPFLSFAGRWKRRQALWTSLLSLPQKGRIRMGWCRRPLDCAFRGDNWADNICEFRWSRCRTVGWVIICLQTDRQKKKSNSEILFNKKHFFPPAYASLHKSRSQQVDWNRACSFMVI